MGIYVNPVNRSFKSYIKSKVYVDKSPIIIELNELYDTTQKFVCMSRARRFGKTMMANLISAYYSKNGNSRDVFEGLKLSHHKGWDTHLNSENVIKIDLNGQYNNAIDKSKTIKQMQADVVDELRKEFPSVQMPETTTIASAIALINSELNETFVIIIDEYDVLIRDKSASDSLRKEYISFLNSLFKNDATQDAITLAYITGILPIIRDRVESKLNNFVEYTMLSPKQFAPYFGFTWQEVEELCIDNSANFDACKSMYDGYLFKKPMRSAVELDDATNPLMHIFNPNSVVQAITSGEYEGYWTATGAIDGITYYLDSNIEGIQDDVKCMLNGIREVNVSIGQYQNNVERFTSKDAAFTYLIHLGYLGYNPISKACFIPNGEIREAWFNIMSEAKGFEPISKMIKTSAALVKATEAGDSKAVAAALDDAHADISSPLSYNKESTLQSAILMAYFYARKDYTVLSEVASGSGYADVVLVPSVRQLPVIIIELKRDGEPEVALEQIKSRRYAHAFRHNLCKGAVLVGVSYDSESKRHRCVIEKVEECEGMFLKA
ncbi:MAG: AAA family ATPase [Bacteroidales bacterium]|nr:ATP-binding protein [Bacteroidales bacterium]MDY4521514.1 AAA family ATPase [Bacteroidales bacterium]